MARPQVTHCANRLVGSACALLERHAERGELGAQPARTDTDEQTPVAEPVDGGQRLGGRGGAPRYGSARALVPRRICRVCAANHASEVSSW